MPLTFRHKEQRAKNFTLLFVLLGIAIFLFGLTTLKIAGVL